MFRLGRDCLCRKESPRLGRWRFPLCWRCSGVLVGLTVVVLAGSLRTLPSSPVTLAILGGSCGLPAGADVFFQVVSTYRSTPRRRLWTGLLLGAAIVLLSQSVVSLLRSLLD